MATVKPDEVSQKVEVGIEKHEQWAEILNTARKVMLSTEMEEAVKWGTPPTRLRERTWSVSRHSRIIVHCGFTMELFSKMLTRSWPMPRKARRGACGIGVLNRVINLTVER